MRGQIAHREGRPENLLNLARLVRIARCDNQLHARILIFGSSRSSMSSERRKPYPFDQIEPKWQAIWEERQLPRIGFSYDWQREINTTDPGYYKWTQWIFLQIYNSWLNPETKRAEPISTYRGTDPDSVRLAYVADVPVNWCPELGTVLANEEVVDGKSEIGGFPVVRRPMRQWMLRITAYAERLIKELDDLDWPEGIKLLQRNWIGRSEGAEVEFRLDKEQKIHVFTTRPDTLYGATYMVLAPEHPLIERFVTEEQWPAVREYRKRAARKRDLERTELAKEKTD